MPSESIRRRTRGSTSSNYTAVLPNLLDANEPRYDLEPSSYSTSSSHIHPDASFLLGDDVEDVQADVLYPRFSTGNSDQSVDMAAFDSMVKDHQRKMSTGSLHLTRTLSRQNKLYGSDSKHARPAVADRYKIYTTQRGTGCTSLAHLLTERGKQALSEVVKNKGWWLDVVSPTPDEMAVISKTFHIHPLTTEDVEAQEPREKVELFPNYTFVCFRAFYIDPIADIIKPFNFYNLIFKDGLITFHFVPSEHCDFVRSRADQLKEYMTITPDWLSYALVDSVTDSFAPIILQVEMEAVSIDELSMVLKKSEQPDMLKRISRCRKRSTQLARLLNAKLDVIKSLMKRYEDKSREYLLSDHSISDDMTTVDEKKSFNDVLLYLGDIQDHIVTMVQNINHYDRILHRAHTNYLAQVNLELTQTYNMTNNVMNRLTFLATVFIPLTLVSGLWGMNVYVPGKDHTDLEYFFWIIGGMMIYATGCTLFGKRIGIL